MKKRDPHSGQNGFALVAVLFVMAIFFVLAAVLLFQSQTERIVAINEQDHLAALGHAEAGLTWAQRRVFDTIDKSDLLNGPDDVGTGDDNLLGLRDLSLTATGQFTGSNEATASAIVARDFDGQGNRDYEAFRIVTGAETRALVYVRIDDNYDDDPTDPDSGNDPLTDTDDRIMATAVAEYPVFVDATGAERTTASDRGRAQRMLTAVFGPPELSLPAIASNGDIIDNGNTSICGECGSVHSNEDLRFTGSTPTVCEDATASGTLTATTTNIGGSYGSGYPPIPIPTINPYDDVLVPTLDTFDTSADAALSAGLRCPRATAADPGANKYFALVSDAGQGRVYKAYWDFTNNRWTWLEIDNLAGAGNTILDDCGRVQGLDPNFGAGSAGAVDDGSNIHFYGFDGGSLGFDTCDLCSSPNADATLCGLADNDYNVSGHYQTGGGFTAVPRLPGSFEPDGNPDFNANVTFQNSARWDYDAPGAPFKIKIFSPMYGAVLWVVGGVKVAGDVGAPGSIEFTCSAGAGCASATLPDDLWRASLIALANVEINGNVSMGPANPAQGYHIQAIAGRDLVIAGDVGPPTASCASGCSATAPAGIEALAGVYAAHEQVSFNGTPHLFGLILADHAIDCSGKVSGDTDIGGTVDLFYDCVHPPNPWLQIPDLKLLSWQESD